MVYKYLYRKKVLCVRGLFIGSGRETEKNPKH